MNASLLSALSAAISDNPVHVLQLRKIVVALAISGRLNEVDASIGREEILALIGDVKRRLISQRVLAKQKPIVAITRDQLPEDFIDPSKFVSLGHIARVEKGKTGIQQAKPGPYPLVVTAAERITADHYDFDGAAAIIPLVSSTGHGNASINRLHYQEGQFALGTILAAVLPHDPALFSARFLFEYLSAFKEELLVSRMSGTANVTLTLGRIEDVPVPLVPPAIQQQLDELMALCDELEAARTERETKRDRLAVASLARLNTPDPETFRDDARFALDALPALTARPEQIKQLRQTILNLAVRGKLVPQDPADEQADVIGVADVGDDEGRLNALIPSSWQWVRVADVADARLGKMLDKAKNHGKPYPYLRNTNVHWFDVRLDDLKLIPLSTAEFEEYQLRRGDVLICEGGHGIGRTAVWKSDISNVVFQKALHRVRPGPTLNPDFFSFCCLVYYEAGIMQTYFTGVGIPHFTGRALSKLVFPLPPLAEQHRIVAKVDELMALCDQLETSLTSADETRKKLLDALLAEALAPVDADALQEAAE